VIAAARREGLLTAVWFPSLFLHLI
jgi:hypothetical protein